MLAERSDIEIIAQYFRDGYHTPRFFYLALVVIALRFLACLFSHTGRWDMLIGQMVGDSFVPPAVDIELEYFPNHLGRRLVHLEQHFL